MQVQSNLFIFYRFSSYIIWINLNIRLHWLTKQTAAYFYQFLIFLALQIEIKKLTPLRNVIHIGNQSIDKIINFLCLNWRFSLLNFFCLILFLNSWYVLFISIKRHSCRVLHCLFLNFICSRTKCMHFLLKIAHTCICWYWELQLDLNKCLEFIVGEKIKIVLYM